MVPSITMLQGQENKSWNGESIRHLQNYSLQRNVHRSLFKTSEVNTSLNNRIHKQPNLEASSHSGVKIQRQWKSILQLKVIQHICYLGQQYQGSMKMLQGSNPRDLITHKWVKMLEIPHVTRWFSYHKSIFHHATRKGCHQKR